jgi:hypothetical protein
MTRDRSELPLDQALAAVFSGLMAGTHTAIPAEIVSFDGAAKTIKAQPVLQRLYEYKTKAENLPVIEDIPVVFPGSGDFWLTFEPKKGSYALLIVAERSLEIWLNQGGIVDPQQERRFDLSDSIAICGVLPKPDAAQISPVSGMALRNKAGTNGFKLTDTSVEMFFGAFSIKIDTTGIHIVGDVDVIGTVTADDFIIVLLSLLTHIHSTPAGNSGPPIPGGP